MAGTIVQGVGTLTTLIDQTGSAPNTLASIAASGAAAITSSAYDNSTNRYFFADFELVIGYAVSPVAGTTQDLFIFPSLDGTNFNDATASNTPASVVFPQSNYVGSFIMRNQTAVVRLVLSRVAIPPLKFNVGLLNNAAQATATSGTTQTLKIIPYYEAYT